MLIEFLDINSISIDLNQYKTTIAVKIFAPDENNECGIFAGTGQYFTDDEKNKCVPVLSRDKSKLGIKTYLIDRHNSSTISPDHRNWNYFICCKLPYEHSQYFGNYNKYYLNYELELSEHNYSIDNYFWSFKIKSQNNNIDLILSDYKPGATFRSIIQYSN